MMMLDIGEIWERVKAKAGQPIERKTGKPFTYMVMKGGNAIVIEDLITPPVPKRDFETALGSWPIPGPGALYGRMAGSTYVWAILNDLVGRDEEELKAAKEATARHRESLKARNKAIRAAKDGGWSIREIGDATGLSHSAVDKIVRKADSG